MSAAGASSNSDAYRRMQADAARIAAQTATKMRLDPVTIGARFASMSPVLDSYRESIAKLTPALTAFRPASSFKMDVLAPELARTASPLVGLGAFTQDLPTPPGMQALADSVRSYQPIVSPELAEAMRGVITTSIGTEQFAHNLVQAPGFADTLQNIASINAQVGNFAEMYAKITEPLAEALRASYEGTKLLDGFDFSVLDDIDEDAFEEFLDEHPELEETYEAIEETLVRRGLISTETFRRAGARFRSSTVAKHLMIAVIMFSASAALMFAVKSLPDDLEDEGMTYLGIVGFMYTAYSVHSAVKNVVAPPDVE